MLWAQPYGHLSARLQQGSALTKLFMQAVRVHTPAPAGSDRDPAPALLAALSSVHAFMSSPIGIDAACREPALVVALCEALQSADADGKRIVIEVLCRLCIYSARSHRLALQASLCTSPTKVGLHRLASVDIYNFPSQL